MKRRSPWGPGRRRGRCRGQCAGAQRLGEYVGDMSGCRWQWLRPSTGEDVGDGRWEVGFLPCEHNVSVRSYYSPDILGRNILTPFICSLWAELGYRGLRQKHAISSLSSCLLFVWWVTIHHIFGYVTLFPENFDFNSLCSNTDTLSEVITWLGTSKNTHAIDMQYCFDQMCSLLFISLIGYVI